MPIMLNLLLLLLVFGIVFLPTMLVIKRLKKERATKRSPLKEDLLRGPGESLREKIDELREKIDERLTDLLFPFIGGAVLIAFIVGGKKDAVTSTVLFLLFFVVAAGITVHVLRKLSELWKMLHNYNLALDAELAVGQELNYLMRDGYTVFHDFQFDNFNIDHIAVGPTGVFAIETKGRAKPDRGLGTKDATIEYDGRELIFPEGSKSCAPLDQAKRQAQSLAKWLSSAVGESVRVRPVLAYPGWFIKKKKLDDFIFLYGNQTHYRKLLNGPPKLNEKMITSICHQLDQRCRNVESKAYKKEDK